MGRAIGDDVRGWTKTAVGTAAVLCALASGAAGARAAGPGETFLVGGLPLPSGAIAGGSAGGGDGAEDTAISADGRYVAFVSQADTLAPEAGPDLVNVFRKDRQSGAVELVSRADGPAGAPAQRSGANVTISDDGSRVGWVTAAGVDPGDSDSERDVYVRDLATQQTFLATGGISSDTYDYDLSGDGAWIAFSTQERLTAGDGNAAVDVYRREVASGTTRLVSAIEGTVTAGNRRSAQPTIDDDGQLVAFSSEATDLIAGFVAGNGSDVFLRDVANSRTRLVSRSLGGAARGSGSDADEPDIAGGSATLGSATVAWDSRATDVDAADGDPADSVFVRTMSSTPRLVSRADGALGANADERAHTPSISDDGQRISFAAQAGNLGNPVNYYGTYVRDVGAGRTTLLSAGSSYAVYPAISGDGGYVAWYDQESGRYGADPDLHHVIGRTYSTPPGGLGAAEVISRPAGNAPFLAPAFRIANSQVGAQTISGDGRYVVFAASSARLEAGETTWQVYRRDTLTGALVLVSRADGPAGAPAVEAKEPSISADGTRVAFITSSSLDPIDGGEDDDVYLRDLVAGTTTLVSRADGLGGAAGDSGSEDGRITSDGRHVAFITTSTNLGVADGLNHAYLRDVAAGRTLLVDRADGAAGPIANRSALSVSPSSDGRIVAFTSYANNIDPADPAPDAIPDIYVRDVGAADTQLVSRRSGSDGAKATLPSFYPVISANGRVVAYQAADQTLAPEGGPWGANGQIVARDLVTQQTTLVSRAPGGAVANSYAASPALDASGETISFETAASNLVPGLGGTFRPAIFVRTMSSGALTGPPAFGLVDNDPQNRASGASISADGQCLSFTGVGHNAVTGVAGDFETLYVHVLSGSCPKPLPKGVPPRTDPPNVAPRASLAPTLTRVSLLRARFRVARGATAVAAATRSAGRRGSRGRRRRATPAGSAFRFTLNVRANLTVAIEQKGRGRKAGRSCRRPTRRMRRRPVCTLWTKVATLRRGGLDGGRRSVAFSGRIGRRALRPGSYRATLKAGNASGSSKPVTLAFTIAR